MGFTERTEARRMEKGIVSSVLCNRHACTFDVPDRCVDRCRAFTISCNDRESTGITRVTSGVLSTRQVGRFLPLPFTRSFSENLWGGGEREREMGFSTTVAAAIGAKSERAEVTILLISPSGLSDPAFRHFAGI